MLFVFELFGGLCIFSTIAFIGLASVAKWRPDLDEDGDLEMLLQPRETGIAEQQGTDLDPGGAIVLPILLRRRKKMRLSPEAGATPRAAA